MVYRLPCAGTNLWADLHSPFRDAKSANYLKKKDMREPQVFVATVDITVQYST